MTAAHMGVMDAHDYPPTRGERRAVRQEKAWRRRPLLPERYYEADWAAARTEPQVQWPLCSCGKIRSSSKTAAEGKRSALRLMHGGDAEVEYYTCETGTWHWSRVKELSTCPCGRSSYPSIYEAAQSAFSSESRVADLSVSAASYTCAHGGNHWTWYLTEQDLTQCECSRVSYTGPESVEIVVDFHRDHTPDKDFFAFQCPHSSWHLGTGWRASITAVGAVTEPAEDIASAAAVAVA